MLKRMALHMLSTCGVTCALTFVIGLNSDEFVAIWLAFATLAGGIDWLQSELAEQRTPVDVLDYFEEID